MQYSVFFICGKRPLPGTLIVQKYRAPVKAAEGSGLQARRAALRGRRQKNLQIFPEKTAGLSNGAYQHVPGGKRRAYTMKTTCTAGFTIERKVDPL
jgi:hypothetical protein